MTSADVYASLLVRFPEREFAVLPQATEGTGFRASRWLDALVVSLWPSRGLWLHGIEIKVSRHDWRRELRQPEKANALFEHLDYFSVAAPAGIVEPETLPKLWGLLELSEAGLAETVKPKYLHKGTFDRPLPRDFFAGLVRRLDQTQLVPIVTKARGEEFQRGKKLAEFELRQRLNTDERERVLAGVFMKAAGLAFTNEADAERLGSIVSILRELGNPAEKWGLLKTLRENGKTISKAAAALEAALSVQVVEQPSTPSPEAQTHE